MCLEQYCTLYCVHCVGQAGTLQAAPDQRAGLVQTQLSGDVQFPLTHSLEHIGTSQLGPPYPATQSHVPAIVQNPVTKLHPVRHFTEIET